MKIGFDYNGALVIRGETATEYVALNAWLKENEAGLKKVCMVIIAKGSFTLDGEDMTEDYYE